MIGCWEAVARQRRRQQGGFALVELMIVVAIIGILATIAVPIYRHYIGDAERTVLVSNIRSIQLFQEDYRLRLGTYGAGGYDADAGVFTIRTLIGWAPRDRNVVYTVTLRDGGKGYRVIAETATMAVCRDFPKEAVVTPCPPG